MSYRTFKRVIGETSLERKCRFLFGLSLLLLILSSFLWCSWETEEIVYDKTRSNSRHLVGSVLRALHTEKHEADPELRKQLKDMATELEDLVYQGDFIALEDPTPEHVQLANHWEAEHLPELRARYREQMAGARRAMEVAQLAESGRVEGTVSPSPTAGESETDRSGSLLPPNTEMAETGDESKIYDTYKGLPPVSIDRTMRRRGEYHYYQPVYWKESCLSCHIRIHAEYLGELANTPNPDPQEVIARMPFRVVRIILPNHPTRVVISRIRSFLIAMGIVTVFLAMIALYIVVRYVIVKPLQHLQLVSEEVEHGNYDARANIHTKDEFEDLAGAFNRMVRHLVDTQGELQQANSQLDLKVDELAQANMQLYEVNRMKSEFLANVSHELRTPLNSIIGFSEVLRNLETLNDKQKKYASNIGRSGKVLLEMINDILDLAKMESGKMNVRPTEFSMNAVSRAQIDVVQALADEKNLDIRFECPEDLPEVYQDQAKVQQILTNLLSNAIKFTPDGGRISVRVEPGYGSDLETPDTLRLIVEDTGIGIASEDYDVIFEKFRQATPIKGSDNLTREYSGTGLGLSIIRELCRLMGGEISFTSQLGHGSTFFVTLPWAYSPIESSDLDTTLETDERAAVKRKRSRESAAALRDGAAGQDAADLGTDPGNAAESSRTAARKTPSLRDSPVVDSSQ